VIPIRTNGKIGFEHSFDNNFEFSTKSMPFGSATNTTITTTTTTTTTALNYTMLFHPRLGRFEISFLR
jgi:hypothetical protein